MNFPETALHSGCIDSRYPWIRDLGLVEGEEGVRGVGGISITPYIGLLTIPSPRNGNGPIQPRRIINFIKPIRNQRKVRNKRGRLPIAMGVAFTKSPWICSVPILPIGDVGKMPPGYICTATISPPVTEPYRSPTPYRIPARLKLAAEIDL